MSKLILLLLLCLYCSLCLAQQSANSDTINDFIENELQFSSKTLELNGQVFLVTPGCKNFILLKAEKFSRTVIDVAKDKSSVILKKQPFITVHGNIMYDFFYRSYLDTPFVQNDLTQHITQAKVNILLAGRYPINLLVRNRTSNSIYFRNTTDLLIDFSRQQVLDRLKAKVKSQIPGIDEIDRIRNAEVMYKNQVKEAERLKEWIKSPARAQEIIEAGESLLNNANNTQEVINGNVSTGKKLFNKEGIKSKVIKELDVDEKLKERTYKLKEFSEFSMYKEKLLDSSGKLIKLKKDELTNQLDSTYNYEGLKDSLKGRIENQKEHISGITDSTKSKVINTNAFKKLEKEKERLRKLEEKIKEDKTKLDKLKKSVKDSLSNLGKELSMVNSVESFKELLKKQGSKYKNFDKADRVMLSIHKVGIGRGWLDYSELTVKNITLSGIQIEVNPSKLYMAFAAGKINYRFRDFILNKGESVPDQTLYAARLGIGKKERNNLIFTFYNGDKLLSSINSAGRTQKVLGFSAESKLALSENHYFVGEVAKSSYTVNPNQRIASAELLKKALDLKTRSNLAFSVKMFNYFPATQTKVQANYKKLGQYFQSFNLNPVNINQEAWMVRVNQYFWRKKLSADLAIRKNDFDNPLATNLYSSKAVFKSAQVTLRVPKYPFISIGYFPSSQLVVNDAGILSDNRFNTLNIVTGYNYMVKKLPMSTTAVFTKFYNEGNDSGFIYYNSMNYTINHNIFFSSLNAQTVVSYSAQRSVKLFGLEETMTYRFRKNLLLSGGLKWTRTNSRKDYFGCNGGLTIQIKQIGSFQFNYDRNYLPGLNRELMPVNIGRMIFIRDF